MKIKLLALLLTTNILYAAEPKKRTNSQTEVDETVKSVFINQLIIDSIIDMVQSAQPHITRVIGYLIEKSYQDKLFDLDQLSNRLEEVRTKDNSNLIDDLKIKCVMLKVK